MCKRFLLRGYFFFAVVAPFIGSSAERENALQEKVPEDFPYPCPNRKLWRSKKPPMSVHRLRPGDIDVIAAIGDSLTAANGGLADNLLSIYFNENRGISWSIGGQGSWRQFLTVPNILKVMNPKLVGYSTGSGNVYSSQAQFNVAYSGAMDQDLMEEAIRLIKIMKEDKRVDFRNHWKLLTLMIGTNDICSDQCHVKSEGEETHKRNLILLLDLLYKNMPKTFVNLVVMPYIPAYAELVDPPFFQCFPMKMITCSCLFGGPAVQEKLYNVTKLTRKFQKIQEEIVESGRYDKRDDFVVVYQPTNLNSHFPKLPESKRNLGVDPHDYSYVAIDCIHYSQKLHARIVPVVKCTQRFKYCLKSNDVLDSSCATKASKYMTSLRRQMYPKVANVYWNNLFEEPGNKTSDWETPAYSKFLCPTERRPYLLTKKNYFIDFSESET